MSVNEDWDVEQYKVEHESDEHWELRRKFLLAHKDKFSEDTLVCLAQVFVNVELLGCRYPEETMDLVKDLSEDVAAEYREKQKTKLQRTFVAASEAASSKIKGRTSQPSTVTEKHVPNTSKYMPNPANQSCRKLNTEEPPSKRLNTEERPSKRRKINVTSCRDHSYGDIILWERPGDVPQSILNTSANISGANLKWEYGQKQGVWECVIYLNSKRLASCTSFNKKIAKNDTARDALNELRKRYYTIKVKPSTDATSNVTVTTKEIKPEATVHDDERKESNGIGEKMMKMMGWMGGGLGKSEQGVVEPMSTTLEPQVSRKGLGLKSGSCTAHEVKAKCQKLFRDFLRTDMQNDIVFLDFTNDERQVIHQIARTMDLKSRSYGPTDKRKLIVSRKIDARTLLRELKSLGGATEKYELVEPAGNKLTPSSTSTSS